MKINLDTWTIEKLHKLRKKINPKPQYQRTPVWNQNKKVFLIDSILRGYDIPKIFLKKNTNNSLFDWEITDGQQRLRSIWEFYNNEFKISSNEFNDLDYYNCYYSELPQEYKLKFKKYQLTISEIIDATQDELRSLFARLQMGMTLLPVELRHALSSNIGNTIFMITENHKFFKKDCKIPSKRFKHQDYLDHVVALIYYGDDVDIKAPTLYKLYLELNTAAHSEVYMITKKINKVLDIMYDINKFNKGIFKNKWGFVDNFWLLAGQTDKGIDINLPRFIELYSEFEKKRKKYNSNSEVLINNKNNEVYDIELYKYIQAFNKQGALKKNILTRKGVLLRKLQPAMTSN